MINRKQVENAEYFKYFYVVITYDAKCTQRNSIQDFHGKISNQKEAESFLPET